MKKNGKNWFKQVKEKYPLKPWQRKFMIWFWSLFGTFIVMAFLFMLLISKGVLGYMPPVDDLLNPKNLLASEIISSDHQVIGQYYKENRVSVKYEDISPFVINALIATEDERFERHTGVDLKALFRAAVKLGRAGGGSTITQQLAKQLWTENVGRTAIQRATQKPTEWAIATQLESLYSKEEIITMYLNRFDFLHNAVGIQSAARIYFSTTPKDLKIEEAATLVGMCKNPSYYNPRRDSLRCVNRRNTVLGQMYKSDFIDKATLDSVSALPLVLRYQTADHKQGLAPYFREYLRVTLTAKEPSYGDYSTWNKQQYTFDKYQWDNNPLYGFCEKYRKPDGSKYDIYRDGLKIYTTIDSRMQKYAEEAVSEHMQAQQKSFFKELKKKKNAPFSIDLTKEEVDGIMKQSMKNTDRYWYLKQEGMSQDSIFATFYEKRPMRIFTYDRGMIDTVMTPYDSIRWQKSYLRCGFMSMDPITGHVKAYVGGPNFANFQYDMCTKGRRQVGSTITPYLYTLAMDEGMWPCETWVYDSITLIDANGRPWTPRDTHDKYQGDTLSLAWGLKESSNWMSAYLMSLFTPEQLVDLMRSFGIKGELDPVVSLCLGPCDVSVEEMVDAYTAFANKGIRTEPLYVTHIEDANGNIIAQFTPKTHEIIGETTSYKMIYMLREVVDHGTGIRARYKYGIKAPMGGKTGTTNNNSDGWFMCFTPSLVNGAWVGGEDRAIHFDNMAEGQGASMALPICAIYLQKIFKDKSLGYSEEEEFDIPAWFDPNEGCE